VNRRLPAFANTLFAKRRRGLAPQRDLLIACDWELGKAWSWRLVVPPDVDPEELDFSVVAGLSCLLVARNQTSLDRVANAVAAYQPMRLVGVNYDRPAIRVYVAASASPTDVEVVPATPAVSRHAPETVQSP
jgi:hypothetical protein